MKVVRNREQARWLPSRYRFAIFRLYALVRLATSTREPGAVIALQIDRDQSNEEQYGIALLVLGTVVSYLAALLPLIPPVAIVVALPLAGLALQVPVYIAGSLLPKGRHNTAINGVILMTLIAAASVFFARSESWARFVAWFFLCALVVNGVASCLMFLLRGRIAAMDQRFGGPAFEP